MTEGSGHSDTDYNLLKIHYTNVSEVLNQAELNTANLLGHNSCETAMRYFSSKTPAVKWLNR